MKTKHRSLLLASVAALGTVATGISAGVGTYRFQTKLDQLLVENETNEMSKADMVKVAIPYYIPSITIALGTIGCIFGLHVTNVKAQESLISSYILLEQTYKNYRERVVEVDGERHDAEIIAHLNAISDDIDEERIFYDYFSERFYKSSFINVINAQREVANLFEHRGYVELNEYYEALGIEPTEEGSMYGWSWESGYSYGYSYVDMNYKSIDVEDVNLDDLPMNCIGVKFVSEPTMDYMSSFE